MKKSKKEQVINDNSSKKDVKTKPRIKVRLGKETCGICGGGGGGGR